MTVQVWDGSGWNEPRNVKSGGTGALSVLYYDGAKWKSHQGETGSADPEPPPPTGALKFEGSSLYGAGFFNCCSIADSTVHGAGRALSAGDVMGVYRTVDDGANWAAGNKNTTDLAQLKVAGLLWHPTIANKCYAYLTNDNKSWLATSLNAGVTWVIKVMPAGTGAETGGDAHPRQTGRMLATNGSRVLVCTKNGLYRTDNDGGAWAQVALAGLKCTGIAKDPVAATFDVLVTAEGTGSNIVLLTGCGSGQTLGTNVISSALNVCQDVSAVNEGGIAVFYIAAGFDGIRRWTAAGGLTNITGPLAALSMWSSLAAQRVGSATTLFAGCDDPKASDVATWLDCIWKSVNGGGSWTRCTNGPDRIKYNVFNAAGPIWWLPGSGKTTYALGKSTYVVSQLSIDPNDANHVMSSGRSGVWHTQDGGSTWYPIVKGISATIARLPLVDPTNDNRAVNLDIDWSVVGSADRFVSQPEIWEPSVLSCSAGVFDGAKLFAGFGQRDIPLGPQGSVWSNPTPFTNATWTNENWPVINRPVGMGMGRLADGTTPVLLCVAEGAGGGTPGMWRQVSGTWTRVNTLIGASTNDRGNTHIHWPAGSAVVYAYDGDTGLWRSSDRGVNWTKIWAVLAGGSRHAGHLDGSGNTLYLSVQDEVYLITNAQDGTINLNGTTATGTIASAILDTAQLKQPGPIAVQPSTGDLYVTKRAPSATLFKVPAPITATSVGQNIADSVYEQTALFPFGIAVAAQGTVYLSLDGNGLMCGRPT